MELELRRYKSNDVSTLGDLKINGIHQCYVCEDAYHPTKIQGKTRIPAGDYKVFLRQLGTSHFDQQYTDKFGTAFHKGMLQLSGVPGYEGVLIHIGNTAKDTDGCLLVGETPNEKVDAEGSFGVFNSRGAYEHFYEKAIEVLERGEHVNITIVDDDR